MDLYKDNYESTNYTRLYLLFFLFLVTLYFWIGGVADSYMDSNSSMSESSSEKQVTTAECRLAGLDSNCNLKE